MDPNSSLDSPVLMRLSELKVRKKEIKYIRNQEGAMDKSTTIYLEPYIVPTISPGTRMIYYYIDIVIYIAILLVLNVFTIRDFWPMLFIIALINILYYTITESILGGSVGKLLFNVSVINDYAKRIDPGDAFVRAIFRWFSIFSPTLTQKNSRARHDKKTNTYVVRNSKLNEIREKMNTAKDGIIEGESMQF